MGGGATGQPGSSVNRTPSQQYQALAGRPGSRSATPLHSSHPSPTYSAGRGGRGATPSASGDELNQMQRFNLQAAELNKMDQELMHYPPLTIKGILESAGLGDKQLQSLTMDEKVNAPFQGFIRLNRLGADFRPSSDSLVNTDDSIQQVSSLFGDQLGKAPPPLMTAFFLFVAFAHTE